MSCIGGWFSDHPHNLQQQHAATQKLKTCPGCIPNRVFNHPAIRGNIEGSCQVYLSWQSMLPSTWWLSGNSAAVTDPQSQVQSSFQVQQSSILNKNHRPLKILAIFGQRKSCNQSMSLQVWVPLLSRTAFSRSAYQDKIMISFKWKAPNARPASNVHLANLWGETNLHSAFFWWNFPCKSSIQTKMTKPFCPQHRVAVSSCRHHMVIATCP